MNQSDFFVTGGALLADAGCYVARAADTDLVAALRAGEFCYVLTTRQMGNAVDHIRELHAGSMGAQSFRHCHGRPGNGSARVAYHVLQLYRDENLILDN